MHDKTPPTALQTEYILASRKATTRTQRTWRTALSVGLVVSLSLAAFAFVQRQQAVYEAQAATRADITARPLSSLTASAWHCVAHSTFLPRMFTRILASLGLGRSA